MLAMEAGVRYDGSEVMTVKVISVTEYGAVPNSTDLQTAAFQRAIDECFLAGAGEVTVPAGRYPIGAIRLRSHVTLHLLAGAVLVGSRDPEDYFIQYEDTLEPYPADQLSREERRANQGKLKDYCKYGSRWYNALIKAYRATDLAVIGEEGSLIDGNDCYDEKGEEAYRGPHCICMAECDNIRLRGYHIVNSSNWAHSMWFCRNVVLEQVAVDAGHDGCHWRHCRNVLIRNCAFATGDDCVAGYNNDNFTVEDCTMNTACSAFRFGATNALIQRCRVWGPPRHLMRWVLPLEDKIAGVHEVTDRHGWNTMLSFFTYASVEQYTKGFREYNENMIFRDITVENTDRFMHYNFSGNEPWQSGCALTGIRFENIRASGIRFPLTAYGVPDRPIRLSLSDVELSFAEGHESEPLIQGAHFKKIELERVRVPNATGGALIRSWSPAVPLDAKEVVFSARYEPAEYPTEPFTCDPV